MLFVYLPTSHRRVAAESHICMWSKYTGTSTWSKFVSCTIVFVLLRNRHDSSCSVEISYYASCISDFATIASNEPSAELALIDPLLFADAVHYNVYNASCVQIFTARTRRLTRQIWISLFTHSYTDWLCAVHSGRMLTSDELSESTHRIHRLRTFTCVFCDQF